MTWQAPITWTTNQTVTSAQLNAQIRDNMLETAPAKATTAGYHFASNGTNTIAERAILDQVIDTLESTAVTTYTNLATDGPTVTMTTGVKALVWHTAQCSNSGVGSALTSFEITGATTTVASDARCIQSDGVAAATWRFGTTSLMATTPGSNTFHMQYKAGSGTATFQKRRMIVMGL